MRLTTRILRGCAFASLWLCMFSPFWPRSESSAWGAEVPIPQLSLWASTMSVVGHEMCAYLATPGLTPDQRLAHTFYDMIRVMYQIADYTGDAFWRDCAVQARAVYRDEYVRPNNGGVPGYWNFTTGLRMDYERTGSPESKEAVVRLSENASYAPDWTPLAWTEPSGRSREVAYTILSYINAEALGEAPRTRRAALVSQAYGHLDQWFVTRAWRGQDVQFSPFMVGLTALSLIRDWEQTQDPRLIPALRRAADYLWADAWVAGDESMRYQLNPASVDGRSTGGSPDLNLLIAPMYAFLYRKTGESKYRDQGDQLFAGGVRRAYLGTGKHFNQNYSWAFDYIRWRSGDEPDPVLVIESPLDGQDVSGYVAIVVDAPHPAEVTRIDYLVDDRVVRVFSPPAFEYQWPTLGKVGIHRLTVRIWRRFGGKETSAPVTVMAVNPEPDIVAVTLARRRSHSITLRIRGDNFLPSSAVTWNGGLVSTRFIRNTELQATIQLDVTLLPLTATVGVVNPPPRGGTSRAVIFHLGGN